MSPHVVRGLGIWAPKALRFIVFLHVFCCFIAQKSVIFTLPKFLHIYSSQKETNLLEYSKKNGTYLHIIKDVRLCICTYVAEKPGGCVYKLTPDDAKFHSLFKSYLYL